MNPNRHVAKFGGVVCDHVSSALTVQLLSGHLGRRHVAEHT